MDEINTDKSWSRHLIGTNKSLADLFRHSISPSRHPLYRHPLRLDLESVDFGEQFFIRTVQVLINDDHVEILTKCFLHLTRFLYDIFQFVVLNNGSKR